MSHEPEKRGRALAVARAAKADVATADCYNSKNTSGPRQHLQAVDEVVAVRGRVDRAVFTA